MLEQEILRTLLGKGFPRKHTAFFDPGPEERRTRLRGTRYLLFYRECNTCNRYLVVSHHRDSCELLLYLFLHGLRKAAEPSLELIFHFAGL